MADSTKNGPNSMTAEHRSKPWTGEKEKFSSDQGENNGAEGLITGIFD